MRRHLLDDRVGFFGRIRHGALPSSSSAAGIAERGTSRRCAGFCAIFSAGILGGCNGPLSALDPAGPAAAVISRLWWVMLAGAGAIFALVAGLLAYAFWRSDRAITINERHWLIGGGLVFPTVTLLALLAYALLSGERLIARDDPNALTVEAIAGQYRWEFRYPNSTRDPSPALVIPVNRPVNVRVTSADVIHSFWVPRLAGKIDAIPGHVNVIRIVADTPGIYRGQCAEFCGLGHTTMQFHVEALPERAFAAFLSRADTASLRNAPEEVLP